MIALNENTLMKKLKSLPPERRKEVEDFVDFLYARTQEGSVTQSATTIAEPAFARIWENKDDDGYDEL